MATDSTCIFCRIVSGEIPATVVARDEHALAFLDVAPDQPGHTLVVPTRHVADLTSDADALTEIAPLVSQVSAHLVDRLDAPGVNLLVNSGEAAGQEVFHLHVHVVPAGVDSPDKDDLAAIAAVLT